MGLIADQNSRVRARKPRSRTGCITCKKRRLKCDEGKPNCQKCIQDLWACEGYRNEEGHENRLRVLKPKVQQSAAPSGKTLPPLPLPPAENRVMIRGLTEETITPVFRSLTNGNGTQTHVEHRFFTLFQIKISVELPGIFGGDLWARLIMQASQEEPFVRDAAVAIGALASCGRYLSTSKKDAVIFGAGPVAQREEYQFALRLFGNAIRGMQTWLKSGKGTIRTTLIACLMVVCFENMQGNYFQALEHAMSGYDLLQGWLDKAKVHGRKMEVIEDEIVSVFDRLDLQILSFFDPRPTKLHRRLLSMGGDDVRNIPSKFKSVMEARSYWTIIGRRTGHFIATLSRDTETSVMSIISGLGSSNYVCQPGSQGLQKQIDVNLETMRECDRYSQEIEKWFDAFNPLLETLVAGEKEWVTGNLLKIEAMISKIMLCSATPSTFGIGAVIFSDASAKLDEFLPEYRTIVTIASSISPYIQEQTFTFEQGLVFPIYKVAKWCRDGIVRRKAIRLLQISGRRDGLYDGLLMGNTQEWLMNMEEEGLAVGEYIPEERRVRISMVHVDSMLRTATVRVARVGHGQEYDERTSVFSW